ncbi:hypothetical protein LZL87_011744 [Fusarium oxysporum]|nr:hypothetical protein LZL87_011744 [Fusarium oxysporum]
MLQKRSLLRALAADEHNQTSFLEKRKRPGPRVVLNGHVDVFPVGDGSGWSRDPWSGDIVDGRLHGRGVVDMKSETASLIIAYAILYERHHLLSGSVALCAVDDEETGGKRGTEYLIEQDKHRWGGDLMLCAEPGSLEIIRFAEKGTLRLTCTVKTKDALGPYLHLSKGAIRTASAFINEVIKSVESLPADLPGEMERHLEKPEVKRAIDPAMGPGTTTIIARPTVNVGTIKGGLKVNMIPETCIFELDIRMPVGMREDTVLELIDTIIPQYEPASITIRKQAAASNPFNYSVIDHPIVSHLKDNAKSLRPGADAPVPIPSMGGSDCKHYRIALNFIIMPEKKILALGSGMVAKPCVDYLLRDKNNVLAIACRTLSSAQNISAGRSSAKAVALDVASLELDHHVAEHDLVISLVPFVHHAAIVQSAIKGNTNVVTTNYDSPAIRELEYHAKAAGITALNEVGVDPGVDHLYAIKTIGEVHEKDGKFYSYCGGLPAPEVSDSPLRFKFSWSPRSALLSQQNSATFLQGGKVIEISNKDLLDTGSKAWLNEGLKWSHIQQQLTGAAFAAEVDLLAKVDEVCSFRSPEERSKILAGLKWMGLFSDEVAAVRDSPLDTLSDQLDKLCSFQVGERDLVMLQHKFVVEWTDGTKNTITSTLELFGEPGGCSAMAKSVGLTCGIAAELLLDCEPAFNKPGVIAPYSREICDPIRVRVEAEGVKLVEHTL